MKATTRERDITRVLAKTAHPARKLIADNDAKKIADVMRARALSGDPGAATVCLMLNTGLLSRQVPMC